MGIHIGSFKLEKTLNFVIHLMGLMFYSFYFTMKIELALLTKYFFPEVRFSRMCCIPYDLASYCIQHCSWMGEHHIALLALWFVPAFEIFDSPLFYFWKDKKKKQSHSLLLS